MAYPLCGAWLRGWQDRSVLHGLPVLAKVAASLQQSWLMSLGIVALSVELAAACIIGQGASTASTPATPWRETPRLTKQAITKRRRRMTALWPIFPGNVRFASQVSGSGEGPLTSSRAAWRPYSTGSGRRGGLQARASQLPPRQSDGCHSRRSSFRLSEGSSPAASKRRAARCLDRARTIGTSGYVPSERVFRLPPYR